LKLRWGRSNSDWTRPGQTASKWKDGNQENQGVNRLHSNETQA
jgi:hypothetical protein